MPETSLLLQIGPYAAVVGTLLSIWRFGIKPKFDKAEAAAVETATWRTEVDNALKSQKPLNAELIEIARWKISAENSLTQHAKDADKVMGVLTSIRAAVDQGNKDSTEQHNKMRGVLDTRCREIETKISEGRKEIFDKIEKIKDDIYIPKG